ncbi:Ninja family protein [Dioscorea alata]|uniref:Ninja family protein n=1 Tax=Dioscorea alata TaxID=55571 RepID=A0ACB7W6M2_DIOAL|nr:Ninja family protein [Dioscorea alata]
MAPFIDREELYLSLGLSLSTSTSTSTSNPTKFSMSPMINKRTEVEKTRKRSNPNPNPSYLGLASLPVLPVQYVPAIDGYGFPCMVPFPVGLVPHLPLMQFSAPNNTGVRRPHSRPSSESYSDSHDQGGGSSSSSNKDSNQSIERKKQKLHAVEGSVKLPQVPSENSISTKTNEFINVKLDDNNGSSNNNDEELMALVSTRGNGPNGTRTIYGYLKRSCKRSDGSVISIECGCHGSSFSPAEFVRHAGGTETANPLRSIVVSSRRSRR